MFENSGLVTLDAWGICSFAGLCWGSLTPSWWFQPTWKKISQIGSFPQVGVKIKNIWNFHLRVVHVCHPSRDILWVLILSATLSRRSNLSSILSAVRSLARAQKALAKFNRKTEPQKRQAGRPYQKESCLPTIIFQGAMLNFEGVRPYDQGVWRTHWFPLVRPAIKAWFWKRGTFLGDFGGHFPYFSPHLG